MQAAFKRCLEEIDVAGMRDLWARVSPHLPQPASDEDTLIAIHHARTQAASIKLKLRAYSHAWLCERNFPSGLPDNLKQDAERVYPIVQQSVGISVNFRSVHMKPAAAIVRGAMEDSVNESYADGKHNDARFVRARMLEARNSAMAKLFGRLACHS